MIPVPTRLAIGLLALSPAAFAGTLHVDAGLTTGANDGSSWADAFQGELGLQAALAAAVSGDLIFVAQGAYKPTSGSARNISFAMIDGVEIYGGFVGGEASPAERPPIGSAPTILNGDLLGNDSSGQFGDNSFHIVTMAGTTASAVLDGFIVRSGNANGGSGAQNDRGGGIICTNGAAPTVRNCRFVANRSSFGGAAGYVNTGGAPTFTDCSFENGNGGTFGGAFDIAGGGSVRYDRCLFRNNQAGRGGALEVFSTDGVFVTNCLFRDNTATANGGGAIWIGGGGNTRIRNCTIVANSATSGPFGGIRDQGSTGETVVNCILWDNEGSNGAQGSQNQLSSGINALYCIVEGGYAGTGNLNVDPLLTDIPGGDLTLTAGSPAIDAGLNAGVPGFVSLDYAHNARFADIPGVPDTGSGGAPIVDIGAFEAFPSPFTSEAGCAGNPALLSSTTPLFAVGQPLGLRLDAGAYPDGLALYYFGIDGTDPGGCGLVLAGIGELLLGLSVFPELFGTAAMAGGVSELDSAVPNDAALAGVPLAFQAANVATTMLDFPVELSNLLAGTIAP